MKATSYATALVALGLAATALGGCQGNKSEQAAATSEPTAPSSEWVGENPTEAAVPVDLPTTRMTNAPASAAATPAPAGK